MPEENNIRSREVTLSKEDVDFLYHAMEDHINMVGEHHGCAWDDSIEAEQLRVRRVKSALPLRRKPKSRISPQGLSKQDFWFIDFTLQEWTDFVNEGVGHSWFKKPQYNALRAKGIISRLRKVFGISPEEYERGPISCEFIRERESTMQNTISKLT